MAALPAAKSCPDYDGDSRLQRASHTQNPPKPQPSDEAPSEESDFGRPQARALPIEAGLNRLFGTCNMKGRAACRTRRVGRQHRWSNRAPEIISQADGAGQVLHRAAGDQA